MQELESFLIQRITPYDQRVRTLTQSIQNKDAEIDILYHAYKDLLQNLESLVGPEKFAEYEKKANTISKYVDDLTKEEQLLLIKLFDLDVPIPSTDSATIEKIRKFKEMIQKTDSKTLLQGPSFFDIVNSPEFDLIINSPDFAIIAANHELTSLVKSPQFKKLASSDDFQQLLDKNGLKFPLRLGDTYLAYKISLLRSIARLDRIFEDFRVNRCGAGNSVMDISLGTIRSPLVRGLSPRKTDPFGGDTSMISDAGIIKTLKVPLNTSTNSGFPFKTEN